MTIYTWIWIITFVGSIILELATANALVSIWFTIGAAVAGIMSLLKIKFLFQAIGFFAVSLLALLAIRPMAASYLRGNIVHTNSDALIGQRVRLQKKISIDQYGEIVINSIHWNATTTDLKTIESGKLVEIIAIEGSKLIVKEC